MSLPSGAGFTNRIVSSGIAGRLIPQEGVNGTKDEYGLRHLRCPFKALRDNTDSWQSLLPTRGAGPPAGVDLPTGADMVVWDVDSDFTGGKAFVDINVFLVGTLDGAVPPDRQPVNDVSLESVQIQGDIYIGRPGTAYITYDSPRTTYRYVVDEDPAGVSAQTTIENSDARPIIIRRLTTVLDPSGTSDGGSGFYTPLAAITVERVQSFRSEKVGNFWCCEAVVSKVIKGQFDPG